MQICQGTCKAATLRIESATRTLPPRLPGPRAARRLTVHPGSRNERLQPGERLPGGKPKPEVVWREAEDALATLMGQWKERFEYLQESAPSQEHVSPRRAKIPRRSPPPLTKDHGPAVRQRRVSLPARSIP
jgi:hypothetical protein